MFLKEFEDFPNFYKNPSCPTRKKGAQKYGC